MSDDADLSARAQAVVDRLRAAKLMLATAESCTGGLIAGAVTAIPGSSDVLDRGFVTYSNESKTEMLGVPAALIAAHGAVSPQVAREMAAGALRHSRADIAVAVTGVAGPGGGTAAKPVGLVYLCAAQREGVPVLVELRLGDAGRASVRHATVIKALDMVAGLAG